MLNNNLYKFLRILVYNLIVIKIFFRKRSRIISQGDRIVKVIALKTANFHNNLALYMKTESMQLVFIGRQYLIKKFIIILFSGNKKNILKNINAHREIK